MSTEEQNKHLTNSSLQHLTKDELTALQLHIKKHSANALKLAEDRFKLTNFKDVYNPDELHDRIAENITNLFRPQLRLSTPDSVRAVYGPEAELADLSTDQAVRLYKDELLTLAKEGKHKGIKDPNKTHKQGGYKYYLSSPFPSDRDLTGEDLINFITQQSSWGPRTARQHPKIGPLIAARDNQIHALQENKRETSLVERRLNDFEKQNGLKTGHLIQIENSYSLDELEKIAHGEGYVFKKVNDTDGNLQSISVSRDGEDPSISIDFKNGGKISDIKQKLAELINPKEVNEDHPVKQYSKNKQLLDGVELELKQAEKERTDEEEKYKLYKIDPSQHLANIKNSIIEANNKIESILQYLPEHLKPKLNQVYTYFTSGIGDIKLGSNKKIGLSPGKIGSGIQQLKSSIQAIQSLKLPSHNIGDMVDFVQQVTIAIKEAEALRKKYGVTPEVREKDLAEMLHKTEDAKEKTDSLEKEASYLREKLGKFKDDGGVKEYIKLVNRLNVLKLNKDNIESLNPETNHQYALDIIGGGGESVGNHADKASYGTWNQKGDEEGVDEEIPDEEIPDEEIGNFVPYGLDYTDSEKLNDASKNLLSYMNKKNSPKFVFGSKGKYSGIQRVASNIIANLVQNNIGEGDTKGSAIVRNIIESRPKNIKVSDNSGWDKLSKIDPYIISKYALLASSYCPHPVAPSDIYQNPKGMFTELIRSMDDSGYEGDLTPSIIKKILGPKEYFTKTFFDLIHQIGNNIINSEYKEDSPQREIFNKIKDLNKDVVVKKDKKLIDEYPGEIRKKLRRAVDYMYGLHHGLVPSHHGLRHDVKDDDDAQVWLKRVNKYFGKKYKPKGVDEQENKPKDNSEPKGVDDNSEPKGVNDNTESKDEDDNTESKDEDYASESNYEDDNTESKDEDDNTESKDEDDASNREDGEDGVYSSRGQKKKKEQEEYDKKEKQDREADEIAKKWLKEYDKKSLVIYQRKEPKMVIYS